MIYGIDLQAGCCRILSLHLAQRPEVIWHFTQFINRVTEEEGPFGQIIELGTGSGHLTLLLGLCNISYNTFLYTFDIEDYRNAKIQKLFEILDIQYYKTDVLIEDQIINFIATKISRPIKTLLLCDDGNKELEFKTYAKYLKPGDFIMVHDYTKTGKPDENVWLHPALSLESIAETIAINNLSLYMSKMWEKSAWLCCRKS